MDLMPPEAYRNIQISLYSDSGINTHRNFDFLDPLRETRLLPMETTAVAPIHFHVAGSHLKLIIMN